MSNNLSASQPSIATRITGLFADTAEFWAMLIALAAGTLMASALYLEFVQGLAPCPLCLMQRIWVVVVGLTAYVGLLHNARWGIYPLLTSLACIVGGGFSIRQLWLQSLPADEVPACGPDLAYMIEVFPLADVLSAMTSGTGDCATVAWSLFGISLPGWALIGFVAMFVFALAQWRAGSR